MSYAIGDLIYGVAGTKELSALFNEEYGQAVDNEEESFDGEEHVEHLYEGVSPWYFGIHLDSIDETSNTDLLDFVYHNTAENEGSNILVPKSKVIEEYKAKLSTLTKKLQEALPEPKLLIMWSRS